MKKFIKLLAFVVDMAFLPVRFVVQLLTVICGCIVYEASVREAVKASISSTIYTIKIGLKPTLEVIFKD